MSLQKRYHGMMADLYTDEMKGIIHRQLNKRLVKNTLLSGLIYQHETDGSTCTCSIHCN